MEKKRFKQKGIAEFQGLSIGKNKTVQVKFKLRYDELLTSVNLLQGLNSDITVHAKCGTGKAMNLGIFTIGAVNFDKDGNAIAANGLESYFETDDDGKVTYSLVDEEFIQLRFMAVLELPDSSVTEKEGGEEWED